MNNLQKLHVLGQSVWYDNIERKMLTGGVLQRMVQEDGLRGVTSNPSIFEKAINGSDDYDQSFIHLLTNNPDQDSRSLFFSIAIEDIQAAADVLRPVYDESDGHDGMVSLEVSPNLAYDTEGTIKEAMMLWHQVDRPNVMIKVPGTAEGIPAFEALTAQGINVNVTLLFSVSRHSEIIQAYLRGLEKRVEQGLTIDRVASVASFFVSRVDGAVDKLLEASDDQGVAQPLQGKIAIANAKLAYAVYNEILSSPRFALLSEKGAHLQRLLWASTGTKNPDYSDVLYVDTLIGPDTVNTVPPATFDAFRDHGTPAETLTSGLTEAKSQVEALVGLGIDLDAVTKTLEDEGVKSFSDAFNTLLSAIDAKAQSITAHQAAANS